LPVGRDPTVGVLDQDQVAVTAQLVRSIGDGTGFDRRDRCTTWRRDADTVVAAKRRASPISGQDAAIQRPREMRSMRQGGWCGIGLRRFRLGTYMDRWGCGRREARCCRGWYGPMNRRAGGARGCRRRIIERD